MVDHYDDTPDYAIAVKRRFNADPAIDPLRVLICTDAAREGINLKTASDSDLM